MDQLRFLYQWFLNVLHNPSIGIPVVVAFYIGLLGLCVSIALQRQKTQLQREEQQKKAVFSILPEDKGKES